MPPSKKTPTNGWNEYQRLVLFRLDEQDEKLNTISRTQGALTTKVDGLASAVSLLKWKVATVSSAIGGVFGAAVAYWVR